MDLSRFIHIKGGREEREEGVHLGSEQIHCQTDLQVQETEAIHQQASEEREGIWKTLMSRSRGKNF